MPSQEPTSDASAPSAGPTPPQEQVLTQFKNLGEVCLSFDEFLGQQRAHAAQVEHARLNPAAAYQPQPGVMTPCGNGDFEEGLDPLQWQAAYGSRPWVPFPSWPPGTTPLAYLSSGIQSGTGAVTDMNAHHTWVTQGPDPVVGAALSTTAPNSQAALRLGNAVGLHDQHGQSCELVSKTFVVPASRPYLSFWYAVVQRLCQDSSQIRPFFWVRVTDAAGQPVPNTVQLSGTMPPPWTQDMVVLSSNHPFNTIVNISDASGDYQVAYKDWSCAEIDLSSQVGKQVTVEFINADCGGFTSWGYTYLDKVCSTCAGSDTGNFQYACEASSHCGPGKICFDYTLPAKVDPATGAVVAGSVTITLTLYQNGLPAGTLSSGLLTRGERHCFDIDAAAWGGLDPSLPGFDFTARAEFAFDDGHTVWPLGTQHAGAPGEGMTPGLNNDHLFRCKSCDEAHDEQAAHLARQCAGKRHTLAKFDCHCPPGSLADCGCGGCCGGCGDKGKGETAQDDGHDSGHEGMAPAGDAAIERDSDCGCAQGGECRTVQWPDAQPCFSINWGNSDCDCLETNDVELLCLSACNCYDNVSFSKLVVHQIRVTDLDGKPVPLLPDGTPSVQVLPSGPIAFGALEPCQGKGAIACAQRELVLVTRGAVGRNYKLSLEGVCFEVTRHAQTSACFVLPLCQD